MSIYRKMRDSNMEYEQLHDVLAFRVHVADIGQCYVTLGAIHATYRHVPERLKDFIANPKSNGYQSLHTVVLGPEGRQVESQIRTHEMHRIAEVGIAAHWRYKEGHLALSRDDLNKIARLRELFEAAQEVTDAQEFLETVKVDLFANEIFAFTPKGDVKFFPQGSTVLDFAYAIHSAVGDHCAGAKVNGRMVPLRYVLKEGDTIEILTKPDQKPNRDWVEIARTGRALSKIRRFIREQEREKGRAMGRDLLDGELKKRGHSFAKLLKGGEIAQAAKHFSHKSPEHLYLALATAQVSMEKVLLELIPAEDVHKELPPESANPFVKLLNRIIGEFGDVPVVLVTVSEYRAELYEYLKNRLGGELGYMRNNALIMKIVL
jgi:GTP pyrophosphokinase